MIDNLIFTSAYLYISTIELQYRKMYERKDCLERPLQKVTDDVAMFVFYDLAQEGRVLAYKYARIDVYGCLI